jgi:hypothetical protein
MRSRLTAIFACMLVLAVTAHKVCGAAESVGDETSVAEKVGEAAKRIGKKIEEGVKKTAKKIEDKQVPEKVERKLKKAVDKTAEGFQKAGDKIKQKLAD